MRRNKKKKKNRKGNPQALQPQRNSPPVRNDPSGPSDNPLQNPSENQRLVARQQTIAFSGPIPPPELLSKYGEIIPNGADRILQMAEKQSTHRRCIEKWSVIGGTILAYFGVLCAGVIAVTTLYLGSQLIHEGHYVSGSIFAGSGLVGLVMAFIYGTRSRRDERARRDQRNKELTRQ